MELHAAPSPAARYVPGPPTHSGARSSDGNRGGHGHGDAGGHDHSHGGAGGHGHSHGGAGGHSHSHGGLLSTLLLGGALDTQTEVLDATNVSSVLEHWDDTVRRLLPRALLVGLLLAVLCGLLMQSAQLVVYPPPYGGVRTLGSVPTLDRPTAEDRRFAVYLNALRMSPQSFHRLLLLPPSAAKVKSSSLRVRATEPAVTHSSHSDADRRQTRSTARRHRRHSATTNASPLSLQNAAEPRDAALNSAHSPQFPMQALPTAFLELPRFQPVDPVYISYEVCRSRCERVLVYECV
jgi:hypothetical protein